MTQPKSDIQQLRDAVWAMYHALGAALPPTPEVQAAFAALQYPACLACGHCHGDSRCDYLVAVRENGWRGCGCTGAATGTVDVEPERPTTLTALRDRVDVLLDRLATEVSQCPSPDHRQQVQRRVLAIRDVFESAQWPRVPAAQLAVTAPTDDQQDL